MANDPNASAYESATGSGYGYTDYGATCYTDIDPLGQTGQTGSTLIVPYPEQERPRRRPLEAGKTGLGECTDGLSNTIAIAEDAGRDATYVSQYAENYYGGTGTAPTRNVPGFSAGAGRRFWRWAEPHCSLGVSGGINNKFRPDARGDTSSSRRRGRSRRRATRRAITRACSRSTPGGINALFGDGSVRFIKDSINVVTLRNLVTLKGGEVISSDQY